MITASIDFETYYDGDCTVKKLGPWLYTQHPDFECYMISYVDTTGVEWVGEPKDFDWKLLNGKRLIAHNATFEQACLDYLREKGILPNDVKWAEFFDSADMAAYLKVPRSLFEAMFNLCGIKIDKGMRDKARGKHWADMDAPFRKAMLGYCLGDSRDELKLWLDHSDKWPAEERLLSTATREMAWGGVPIDIEGTDKAIVLLKGSLLKVRKQIPWASDPEAPALSPKAVKAECAAHAIMPPKSMAKDSDDFEKWLQVYGEKFPWARAMGVYRSMNALYKKVLTMRARTDKTGRFRYGMKYFGGHTGRDSGDTGFNPQNLSRAAMHGVFLRNLMIKAPKGKILGIVDEGQIEPRVLACLSGDEEKLTLMRAGMDVYEIQARLDNEYDDPRSLKEVDKPLRQYNKVKVLACGFGAGTEKIQFIAKKEVGLELTLTQAENIKNVFRSRKFVPDLWNMLERDMRRSKGGDYEMELPSGRIMLYRDVLDFNNLSAVTVKHGKLMRLSWWGGSLTENAVQSTARDIFMWHVLVLIAEGFKIILRAHDEVVLLLDEATAEADLARALAIMRTPPPWMPDFPAAADGGLSHVYTKM
jgi:hypothetical protein